MSKETDGERCNGKGEQHGPLNGLTREDLPSNDLLAESSDTSKPGATAGVLIVGAGLAGLAAAQKLYAMGYPDVIVFEAQNRIGGRVHTIEHSGSFLELVSI